MVHRKLVPRKLPDPRGWAEVALKFEMDTGIRIGKPRADGDELGFLDNEAWEGRDTVLVSCLNLDTIGPLITLIGEAVTTPRRRRGRVPVAAARFVDDREEARRLVGRTSALVKKALAARRLRDVLVPEEVQAMEAVADIGPMRTTVLRGRPRERYVGALWMLIAILMRLRRSDKGVLTDADMARLVALICPELLRLDQVDVVELVRKHRRRFTLTVVNTPDVQKVIVWHPKGMRPGTGDGLSLLWMWPGFDFEYYENSELPVKWRRSISKVRAK